MNEGESNLLGWLTFVATLIAAAVAWRNHSSQQKQKREKRALELIEKFRETKPDRDKVFEDIGGQVWQRPRQEYERHKSLYDCIERIARETYSGHADKNLLFQHIGQDYVDIRQALELRIQAIARASISTEKFRYAEKSQPRENNARRITLRLKKKEYDVFGYHSKRLKDEWSRKLKGSQR